MADFARVWEVVQVFPRYAWYEKVALVVGLPIVLYTAYLVTVGRPQLTVYQLTLEPSLMQNGSSDLMPDGLIVIMMEVVNKTSPAAEVHNIQAEISIDRRHIVSATKEPDGADAAPGFVRYFFNLPLLYKDTGSRLIMWRLTSPSVGEKISIWSKVVASEVNWRTRRYDLENDGKNI